jgi:hypothetical protein
MRTRRSMPWLPLVVVLLAACPFGFCQKKVQVFVKHEGSDSIGNQLAFSIRESIRRSAGYSLTDEEASTVIELVTAETVPNGAVSVVSLVIIKKGDSPVYNFNLAHLVYSVGSLRVKDTADDIVATLDKQVNEFSFLYTKP